MTASPKAATRADDGWLSRQQGFFGEKAIATLAAAGGISCSKPELDLGFDLNVEAPSGDLARLQIKTVRTAPSVEDGCFRYPLDVHSYERLRVQMTQPTYLVVMEVPARREEWVECSESGFLLRRGARYVSLQGQPATSNSDSVTVSLPLSNIVTPDVLRQMAEGSL